MTTSVSGTPASAMQSQDVDTLVLGDSSRVEDAGILPHFGRKGNLEQVGLFCLIAIAFLAMVASIPVTWNRALNWHGPAIATLMYAVAGHGITVGFHRYFTHGSFRATRWLRIALAVAGSLAIEGPSVRQPGQVSQSLVAGGFVHGRVMAQPPPWRPDLRPSWSRARPARQQRPHHLGFRGAGLGLLGPLATCRKVRRQATPANRTKHKGLCSDMMAW